MTPVDTSAAPWNGVPLNPERDGWHWLRRGGVFVAPYRWTAGKVDPRNGFWLYPPDWEIMPEDKLIARQVYLGPAPTPEEHAALLAERAAFMEERAALVASRAAEVTALHKALDLRDHAINFRTEKLDAMEMQRDEARAALATARREGAEAMREKAAALAGREEAYAAKRADTENQHDQTWYGSSEATAGAIASHIRALPLPGDEPTEGTSE